MIIIIFLSFIFTQIHFTELPNSTGVSQMVIIEEIIGLDIGDEVGLFDTNGLLNSYDCSDQYGELLVGSGVYTGTQLEIVNAGSIDFCDINDGYQLSGYLNNHSINIKVWDASENVEYIPSFTFVQGSGNWGDFLSIIDLLIVNELSSSNLSNLSLPSFSLSPNPFNSFVNIYLPYLNNQESIINIYDINGKKVDSIKFDNFDNLLTWDASSFQSGIYFFSFLYNDKLISKKVTLIK